jgi:hypothetical protein
LPATEAFTGKEATLLTDGRSLELGVVEPTPSVAPINVDTMRERKGVFDDYSPEEAGIDGAVGYPRARLLP